MQLFKKLFASSEEEIDSDDYDLKIDDQVVKFLDLNHKLTFFMITAAVGTLAFTIDLSVSESLLSVSNNLSLALLILASLTALLSAGYSLRALYADISSFRRHLKYRYVRKSFNELSREEQESWDDVNKRAARSRHWASTLLISTVTLQIIFLVFTLVEKGAS